MRRRRWALTRDQAEWLEEAGEIFLLALHIAAAVLLTGITIELFSQIPQ